MKIFRTKTFLRLVFLILFLVVVVAGVSDYQTKKAKAAGTVDLEFTLYGVPAINGVDYCPSVPQSSVTATLHNAGPSDATGVALRYVMYAPYGNQVPQTVDMGTIPAGGDATLTLNFNPPISNTSGIRGVLGGVTSVDQTDSDGLGDAVFAVCTQVGPGPGPGPGNTPPPQGNPDYNIRCPGDSQTVNPGGSGSFPVTVESLNGYFQPVRLSALVAPARSGGPTTQFSINPVVPSGVTTLVVRTTAQTPTGVYTVTVSDGVGQGTSGNHVCNLVFQVVATQAPDAHIYANGQHGSITIAKGSSATLTWDSSNAVSCQVSPGGWTDLQKPAPGQTTGTLNSATRYTLTCTAANGLQKQDFVDINVTATPDFSLVCNGGSREVDQGQSASYSLSVDSSNGFNTPVTFSVQVQPATVNPPTTLITPNPITPPGTSTLVVTTTAQTSPAAYSLFVQAQGAGLTRKCSLSFTVKKGDDNPGGGNGGGSPNNPAVSVDNSQCGKISISWQPTAGPLPSGYHLYRSASAAPYVWQQVGGDLPSTVLSYQDVSPLNPTGFNYYAVSAFNDTGESKKAISIPIIVLACQFNVTSSDKDVIAINGVATGAVACNNQTDPVKVTDFASGDLLTFQINVCNISGTRPATNVTVQDSLENLTLETTPVRFTKGCSGDYSPKPLSGSSFSASIKSIPSGAFCGVIVSARLNKPVGTPGTIYRFQNCAAISVDKAAAGTVCTTPFFYGLNDFPKRKEISP